MSYVERTIELSGLHTLKVIQDTDAQDPLTDWDPDCTILHWHRRYAFGDNPWHRFDISRIDDRLYHLHEDEDGAYEVVLSSIDEIEDCLRSQGAETVPVYLYDHSGITMSTSPFSCPWDSGQVGFAVMSEDEIKKTISIYRKGFSPKRREVYTTFRTCKNEFPIGDKRRKVWTEWFNADVGRWTHDEYWWTKHVRVTEADRKVARERMVSFVKEYDKYLTNDVWGVIIEDEDGDQIEGCWGYFGIDHVEDDVIPGLLEEYDLHEESHEEQLARIEAEADEEIASMMLAELGAA